MFSPKPLRYPFDDYEPFISSEIMELHYNKHYLTYLKNLNTAIEKYPENFQLEVHQILEKIKEIPEDIRDSVRDNGGGVVNHEILWATITNRRTDIHSGKLKRDIEAIYGSMEDFQNEFFEKGIGRFGSGWVWFAIRGNGELEIYSTPNQDSPYMDGKYPVFGIDLWEHAYYLQHKNVRVEYMKEIWKILDWGKIEERYLSRFNY